MQCKQRAHVATPENKEYAFMGRILIDVRIKK